MPVMDSLGAGSLKIDTEFHSKAAVVTLQPQLDPYTDGQLRCSRVTALRISRRAAYFHDSMLMKQFAGFVLTPRLHSSSGRDLPTTS